MLVDGFLFMPVQSQLSSLAEAECVFPDSAGICFAIQPSGHHHYDPLHHTDDPQPVVMKNQLEISHAMTIL